MSEPWPQPLEGGSPLSVPPCPLCGAPTLFYSFTIGAERFDRCGECGLLFHKASQGRATENHPYADDPVQVGTAFGRRWFDVLATYAGIATGRLGIVGTISEAFLVEARRRGFDLRPADEADDKPFDVIVLCNALERTQDPVAFVRSLRGRLVRGGVLATISRSLAKGQLRRSAAASRSPQRWGFTDDNRQAVYYQTGFEKVLLGRDVAGRRGAAWAAGVDVAFGTLGELRESPRLSIVVPVYNEVNTTRQILDALVAKRLPGIDIEIVVVESNSTDGSRDVVLGYQGMPNVRLVLQPAPTGKGAAVREGIEHATGDIVLIQDADLEYDMLDYEVLVAPIVAGRTHFVLGTRHAGYWKIRQFGQMFLADALNLSHWVLVWLVNRFYGQALTDPFTMFKVFRRDCLYGLQFECGYFDFDVELVCKLMRKGYVPLEVPVNYQARSFAEGKKIRFLRDGSAVIRAILRYSRRPVFTLPEPATATAS